MPTLSSPKPAAQAALLDVRSVAEMLGCSPRHVFRLADAGQLPPPIHVGRLVRWNRADLNVWIGNGCPAVTNND